MLRETPWPRLYPVPYWAARQQLLPGEWREERPQRGGGGAMRRERRWRSREGRMRALAEAAGYEAVLGREGRGRWMAAPRRVEEGADETGVS